MALAPGTGKGIRSGYGHGGAGWSLDERKENSLESLVCGGKTGERWPDQIATSREGHR